MYACSVCFWVAIAKKQVASLKLLYAYAYVCVCVCVCGGGVVVCYHLEVL